MDQKTIAIYLKNAGKFAEEYSQAVPSDIYSAMELFFKKEGVTLDVGCGSGRDLHFLKEKGFTKIHGCDAVPELFATAKRDHPDIDFKVSTLPRLEGYQDQSFDNLTCSGVLMHLPQHEIVEALVHLLRVLKSGGTLLLSFRPAREPSEQARESDGRLYTPLHPDQVGLILEGLGAKILLKRSEKAGDKKWHTLVVRKERFDGNGLRIAQTIAITEQKTASYKLALLLSLVLVSQNQPKAAIWEDEEVLIPLHLVSSNWIILYWDMVRRKISNITSATMKFGREISSLIELVDGSPSDLRRFYEAGKLDPKVADLYQTAIEKITATILAGPARYCGPEDYSIFQKVSRDGRKYLRFPIELWRDLTLFAPWIEARVLFEWFEFLQLRNSTLDHGALWKALTSYRLPPERAQGEIRELLGTDKAICVWTKKLTVYHVDHMIPFALLKNNDLWNLMPADAKVNRGKSDQIPTRLAFEQSRAAIMSQWRRYAELDPERFWGEVKMALTEFADAKNSELAFEIVFQSLIELADRVALTYGRERWSPENGYAVKQSGQLKVADRNFSYKKDQGRKRIKA